jgi:hypothetical protein
VGNTQAPAKPDHDVGRDQDGSFDMEAYLAKHGFEIFKRKPWNSRPGALIYEMKVCPFNSSHTDGDAEFTLVDGTPGFGCHHDGCDGKSIKEVFSRYPPERSAGVAVTEWPELIPFACKKPDPIPTNCLPGWLGEMARAVSESTETPFDLAALLALAVASSCISAKADLSPELGYSEPLNLYVCPAMESGNRKTAVFSRLIAPLVEWERMEGDRMEPDRRRLLSERKTMEGRIDRLRRKAASANDPRVLIQEIHQLETDLPEVPSFPRLFSNDVTPERLRSPQMAETPISGTVFGTLQRPLGLNCNARPFAFRETAQEVWAVFGASAIFVHNLSTVSELASL